MNENGDRLLDPNARERIGRWVGETQQIVGMLPDVLAETERLRARLDASESEAERLRQELLGFRSENQQLRAEREAATEGLGRLMEQIQVLGAELERRFKTSPARRSPFEREPELRVQSV